MMTANMTPQNVRTKNQPLPEHVRESIRTMIAKLGIVAASDHFELAASTIYKCLAGEPVRPSTRLQVYSRL